MIISIYNPGIRKCHRNYGLLSIERQTKYFMSVLSFKTFGADMPYQYCREKANTALKSAEDAKHSGHPASLEDGIQAVLIGSAINESLATGRKIDVQSLL